jgi:hypothetical protein
MDIMKEEDIKIDFDELEKSKEINAKERAWFIDYWVDYIKKHPDKVWSKAQNIIIDSQILLE